MSKTNFEKVMEFNRAFDMVEQEPSSYNLNSTNPFTYARVNIFNDSPNIVKLRLELIKEEIDELYTAIEQNDITEQRDACADILYVVYGMADVLGISIDNVFKNNIIDEYLSFVRINGDVYDKLSITNQSKLRNYTNFMYLKYFINEIEKDDSLNTIKDEYILLQTICEYAEGPSAVSTSASATYIHLDINDELKGLFECISIILYKILKSTYSYVNKLGYDADKDFSIVHESNMSKLCDSEEDAKATVLDYENKYTAGTSPYDSPYYYYLPNLNKWIIKNKSTGKVLKNIKYKKVKFT